MCAVFQMSSSILILIWCSKTFASPTSIPSGCPSSSHTPTTLTPTSAPTVPTSLPTGVPTIDPLYLTLESVFFCDWIATTDIGTYQTSWNCASVDLRCSWPGIVCQGGYITGITFSGDYYVDQIPSSISTLSKLELFDAKFYSKSTVTTAGGGPDISSHIGVLSSLTFLKLEKVRGRIPSSFALLSNLKYFDCAYRTSLTGSLPNFITGWRELTYLNLKSTGMLTGTIPGDPGNITSLVSLNLEGHSLTGSLPSWLGTLSTLTYLNVDYNSLNGTFPLLLGNISLGFALSRIVFAVHGNSFSGSIPYHIKQHAAICDIDIALNYEWNCVVPPIDLCSQSSILLPEFICSSLHSIDRRHINGCAAVHFSVLIRP